MNRRFFTRQVLLGVSAVSLALNGEVRANQETDELVSETRVDSSRINLTRLSALVFDETNRVRRSQGLAELRELRGLNSAAEEQASFMALMLHCTHSSFLTGKRTPRRRIERVGLLPSFVAENAAMVPIRSLTQDTAAAALVQGWMDSPGHRANLLSPDASHLGCAIRVARLATGEDAFFAVQVFFRPQRAP